eukprot:CAMPEP_0118923366 /NCGR_PEP_ID=MMETSP1169-20130426/1918_1 /TAXON_ID=36882 /ORGANISM="Pyramimonas obovata, Strain CCMP722" /LENGTH=624 /DNA_ID=CAMNT_0006864339 /DNA_START=164 /DNA_END=2034 /DNA_ORIENTATION=+
MWGRTENPSSSSQDDIQGGAADGDERTGTYESSWKEAGTVEAEFHSNDKQAAPVRIKLGSSPLGVLTRGGLKPSHHQKDNTEGHGARPKQLDVLSVKADVTSDSAKSLQPAPGSPSSKSPRRRGGRKRAEFLVGTTAAIAAEPLEAINMSTVREANDSARRFTSLKQKAPGGSAWSPSPQDDAANEPSPDTFASRFKTVLRVASNKSIRVAEVADERDAEDGHSAANTPSRRAGRSGLGRADSARAAERPPHEGRWPTVWGGSRSSRSIADSAPGSPGTPSSAPQAWVEVPEKPQALQRFGLTRSIRDFSRRALATVAGVTVAASAPGDAAGRGGAKSEGRKQRRAEKLLPRVVKHLDSALTESLRLRRNIATVLWALLWIVFHTSVMLYLARTGVTYAVVSSVESAMAVNVEGNVAMEPTENPFFMWLENLRGSIWVDPACGNGICEPPYEFPAYETLGCQADCGLEQDLRQIVVVVEADFTSVPAELGLSAVMSSATWNLCKAAPLRREAGLEDLCIYEEDQRFELAKSTVQQAFSLARDEWYVRISGDRFGLVGGKVVRVTGGGELQEVATTWETCPALRAPPLAGHAEAAPRDNATVDSAAPPPSDGPRAPRRRLLQSSA